MQAGTIKLWYRRQFNLTPDSPLYLDATEEQMLVEYYAYQYDDLKRAGKLDNLIEDDDFNKDEILEQIEREALLKNSTEDDWEEV